MSASQPVPAVPRDAVRVTGLFKSFPRKRTVKEIVRAEGAYMVVVADRDETQVPVARRQVKSFREAVGI